MASLVSDWLYPWPSPARRKSPEALQWWMATASEPLSLIPKFESTWHFPWSDPTSNFLTLKRSIHTALQPSWTGPVRYLPPADVTVVMLSTDPPVTDVAIAGVSVYDSIDEIQSLIAVNVSVVEVPRVSYLIEAEDGDLITTEDGDYLGTEV